MFKKLKKYYKKNPGDKIVHFIVFVASVLVVIPYILMVIHILVYGVPDRGNCLEKTLKTSGYHTYPVCKKWEYPDGRPKQSLEKSKHEREVKK
jgi:hypothetical protein